MGKMWWHGQNRLQLPTRDSRDNTSKSKILTPEDSVNKASLFDGKGNIDYGKLENVAGRVRSGSLEIKRLDRQGEQGRIAGGKRNVEASLILAANERASEAAG